MLQRKSTENVDVPLSSVYWEYMKSLRSVIDSEEILNSLPRFQDVAVAMLSSRSAMGTDGSSLQVNCHLLVLYDIVCQRKDARCLWSNFQT